jgi:hypothetical protein
LRCGLNKASDMASQLHASVTTEPAHNERFGASGGATRPSGSTKQQLLALVSTLLMPPPAAKPRGDVAQFASLIALHRGRQQSW